MADWQDGWNNTATWGEEDEMPEFILFVVKETLTDGSHVYNVHFGEMKFAAVDEGEAEELANKIVDAINDHTTQNAAKISEV